MKKYLGLLMLSLLLACGGEDTTVATTDEADATQVVAEKKCEGIYFTANLDYTGELVCPDYLYEIVILQDEENNLSAYADLSTYTSHENEMVPLLGTCPEDGRLIELEALNTPIIWGDSCGDPQCYKYIDRKITISLAADGTFTGEDIITLNESSGETARYNIEGIRYQ